MGYAFIFLVCFTKSIMLTEFFRNTKLFILTRRIICILLKCAAEGRQIVEAGPECNICNRCITCQQLLCDTNSFHVQVIVEGITGILFKQSEKMELREARKDRSLLG